MKRFAVLLICLCLLPCFLLTAFADDNTSTGGAVISVTVPDKHIITVTLPENIDCKINGAVGTTDGKNVTFEVERLSKPLIELIPRNGYELDKVTLKGEDITNKFSNGKYTLPAVYENLNINVTEKKSVKTESTSSSSKTSQSLPQKTYASYTNNNVSSPTTGDKTPKGTAPILILSALVMIAAFKRRKNCRR